MNDPIDPSATPRTGAADPPASDHPLASLVGASKVVYESVPHESPLASLVGPGRTRRFRDERRPPRAERTARVARADRRRSHGGVATKYEDLAEMLRATLRSNRESIGEVDPAFYQRVAGQTAASFARYLALPVNYSGGDVPPVEDVAATHESRVAVQGDYTIGAGGFERACEGIYVTRDDPAKDARQAREFHFALLVLVDGFEFPLPVSIKRCNPARGREWYDLRRTGVDSFVRDRHLQIGWRPGDLEVYGGLMEFYDALIADVTEQIKAKRI